jgi:hypothetical protein
LTDGISYWDELRDSPSQMETCFAIFANVLELDDSGQPVNEKYAEACCDLDLPILHSQASAWPAGSGTVGDGALLMRALASMFRDLDVVG